MCVASDRPTMGTQHVQWFGSVFELVLDCDKTIIQAENCSEVNCQPILYILSIFYFNMLLFKLCNVKPVLVFEKGGIRNIVIQRN